MNIINTIILSIVQGITEFLPISSSAHLIIIRYIFNIQINSGIELAFDLALHFGTILAIIVYFFDDLISILLSIFKKNNLIIKLIIATIPAAIFGILLDDIIDSFFRKQLVLIAIALIIMGFIIYIVDKKSSDTKTLDTISFFDCLLIGFFQIFALIPGFSRSGTTITASRFIGVNREDSTKFSFYLAIPVVLGASLLTLFKKNTISLISSNLSIFGLGILVSFLVGLFCISFLLKYIKKNDFKVFMIYRLIFGITTLILLML